MGMTRRLALLAGAAALAGCAERSKFRTYRGPEVTRLVVNKGNREMFLLHHRRVLERYDIALGFAPEGHKQFEGDGRTPEGEYHIDRRNPDSSFHLSIGISYPNEADIALARAQGKSPGGDIFIHGEPSLAGFRKRDWTAGCIALANPDIEDVYAMVRIGTPITVNA
ncbi:MAG: L,D-transpeptidase family protein [Roseovarius sp.]|jgi:murein L,D-transpeptidase YafK|nr:L,D-transpeptidase family protein [Roseovarius sp.]